MAAAWKRASIQRVKAINSSSRTSIGAREILRAGVVPDDLVFRNPAFRPEMSGQSVPTTSTSTSPASTSCAVDAETFYVLEDNARTPSGVSYMLENREIMMRLFPGAVRAPPHRAGRELSGRAARHAQVGGAGAGARDPTVVLLTPGVYNSAYYEHSFLADKLGVELVEGRDLFVQGRDRLHAHHRRARSGST